MQIKGETTDSGFVTSALNGLKHRSSVQSIPIAFISLEYDLEYHSTVVLKCLFSLGICCGQNKVLLIYLLNLLSNKSLQISVVRTFSLIPHLLTSIISSVKHIVHLHGYTNTDRYHRTHSKMRVSGK